MRLPEYAQWILIGVVTVVLVLVVGWCQRNAPCEIWRDGPSGNMPGRCLSTYTNGGS